MAYSTDTDKDLTQTQSQTGEEAHVRAVVEYDTDGGMTINGKKIPAMVASQFKDLDVVPSFLPEGLLEAIVQSAALDGDVKEAKERNASTLLDQLNVEADDEAEPEASADTPRMEAPLEPPLAASDIKDVDYDSAEVPAKQADPIALAESRITDGSQDLAPIDTPAADDMEVTPVQPDTHIPEVAAEPEPAKPDAALEEKPLEVNLPQYAHEDEQKVRSEIDEIEAAIREVEDEEESRGDVSASAYASNFRSRILNERKARKEAMESDAPAEHFLSA